MIIICAWILFMFTFMRYKKIMKTSNQKFNQLYITHILRLFMKYNTHRDVRIGQKDDRL